MHICMHVYVYVYIYIYIYIYTHTGARPEERAEVPAEHVQRAPDPPISVYISTETWVSYPTLGPNNKPFFFSTMESTYV